MGPKRLVLTLAIRSVMPCTSFSYVLLRFKTSLLGPIDSTRSAMGYNYNGKLRSAEVLLCEDGSHRLIRRAETPRDYFATLDFLPAMKSLFED